MLPALSMCFDQLATASRALKFLTIRMSESAEYLCLYSAERIIRNAAFATYSPIASSSHPKLTS